MNEELEQINSGVETPEVSPEPQSSAESEPAAQAAGSQTEQQPDFDKGPFHQHPRWIERENQLKSERAERQRLENEIRDMRTRIESMAQPKSQAQAERDELIEELKTLNPAFADRFAKMWQAVQTTLPQLEQWKGQTEAERTRQEAVNTVTSLHAQNKVPEELQTRYNNEIELRVMKNPALLRDISSVYKAVHEDYSKWMEGVRRAERESYVTAKKADSKAPVSQPKGKAVKAGQETKFSQDPRVARDEMVAEILNEVQASKRL